MTLPSGVVTFLMTDIEGSTRLWSEAPDAMRAPRPERVTWSVGAPGPSSVSPVQATAWRLRGA